MQRCPPVKPDESDCCHSDCNPCIFDVYQKQLEKYEQNLESPQNQKLENCLSPTSYAVFQLVHIEEHSELSVLYSFKYVRPARTSEETVECTLTYKAGQHFLLKSPAGFTRAYTPIWSDVAQKTFTILVRLLPDGKMSQYLRLLEIGAETLWRGPYGNYEVNYRFKYVLFVAQGTGIAPIYPVITRMLSNENCESFLTLFYCCRGIPGIFLRDKLYNLAANWNFNYEVFLSGCVCAGKYNEVVRGKLDAASFQRFFAGKSAAELHVGVCGNPGFSQWVSEEVTRFIPLEQVFVF